MERMIKELKVICPGFKEGTILLIINIRHELYKAEINNSFNYFLVHTMICIYKYNTTTNTVSFFV